jgi:diphosphomevalonate decarboxylase
MKATANAGSNIAFVKYWGVRKRDREPMDLPMPLNPSVSMTLQGARTTTTVSFLEGLTQDECLLNGAPAPEEAQRRMRRVLDGVRMRADVLFFARVASVNGFPTSAGIASSASGFAALALAASSAAGLPLHPRVSVPLALLGSGSACRSLFGGFVLWSPPAPGHAEDSVRQLATESHWDLVDLVTVVSRARKPVSSAAGHRTAATSPLLEGRLQAVARLVPRAEEAIRSRDLAALGEAMEADALSMHAVIMTARPPVIYWEPETVAVIRKVRALREKEGLACFFTIDAGPNVHVITLPEQEETVARALESLAGVLEVLRCRCGPGAHLTEDHLF